MLLYTGKVVLITQNPVVILMTSAILSNTQALHMPY